MVLYADSKNTEIEHMKLSIGLRGLIINFVCFACLVIPYICMGQLARPLLPMPRSVSWKEGVYRLHKNVGVAVPQDTLREERRLLLKLLQDWGRQTGIIDAKEKPDIALVCGDFIDLPTAAEAYQIDVTQSGIRIKAKNKTGIFYALQTLRQLGDLNGEIPYCSIVDYPAFRWRGYMVDVGRNYQSIPLLKEQIDMMARYKLNIFHFHFTEDIAWRLESRKYPGLTDSTNMERWKGKFYTVADMQELIGYCRERHIQLVPEIDMPGHSAAFRRYFKTDMQSDSGMAVIKNLVKEFVDTYPGLPFLHIGGDEVKIYNRAFLPTMTKWAECLGLQTIGWDPGGNLLPQTIRQLWMGGPQEITADYSFEAVDSKHLYINHMDPLEAVTTLFYRQLGGSAKGNRKLHGAILCSWPDRAVNNERDIFRQNAVYPALLTFAERSWRGGGEFEWRSNIKTDAQGHAEFTEFETRLLQHKNLYFNKLIFPYYRQSTQQWTIYGPVANHGNLAMSLENEKKGDFKFLKKIGEFYGGTVVLRHWWSDVIKGAIDRPLENTTVYAVSEFWSDREGNQKFWIGFNDLSRSYPSDSPALGTWDDRMSRIWINENEVRPPKWQNAGQKGSLEIALVDEGYSYRQPTIIWLKKGLNKVVIKLPVGKLEGKDWQNPLKWMFTCIPIYD